MGGPAGCYWATVEDLSKFSMWLYERSKQPAFMELIKKYGQEFYNDKTKIIEHPGHISNLPGSPTGSASAMFSLSLNTGNTVITLSDQSSDIATHLETIIRKNVYSDTASILENLPTKEANSKETNKMLSGEPTPVSAQSIFTTATPEKYMDQEDLKIWIKRPKGG